MIVTFKTNDPMEVKRLSKAGDMAFFIWELVHNFWRKWKHDETDFNVDNYREELADLLTEHNIDIDDLVD